MRSGCGAGCSTADGNPVPDALVETWQADPYGRFDHPDDPRGVAVEPGSEASAVAWLDAEGRVRGPHA